MSVVSSSSTETNTNTTSSISSSEDGSFLASETGNTEGGFSSQRLGQWQCQHDRDAGAVAGLQQFE